MSATKRKKRLQRPPADKPVTEYASMRELDREYDRLSSLIGSPDSAVVWDVFFRQGQILEEKTRRRLLTSQLGRASGKVLPIGDR